MFGKESNMRPTLQHTIYKNNTNNNDDDDNNSNNSNIT